MDTTNAAAAAVITAIAHGPSDFPRPHTSYSVTVAHAGRNARTGAKIHLATLSVYEDGTSRLDKTSCAGQWQGSLLGGSFDAVTCSKCDARATTAAWRNAKAIQIPRPVRTR